MTGTLDGFVISGTPGVGKSCFLDFCLHNLLRLGKSVCYFYGKTMTAKIIKADGTTETYSIAENFEGALAGQVDFLLIDPPENVNPDFLGGRWGLEGKKFILAGSQIATIVRPSGKKLAPSSYIWGLVPDKNQKR